MENKNDCLKYGNYLPYFTEQTMKHGGGKELRTREVSSIHNTSSATCVEEQHGKYPESLEVKLHFRCRPALTPRAYYP